MHSTTLMLVVLLAAGTAALGSSESCVDSNDLAKVLQCLEKTIVDIDDTMEDTMEDIRKAFATGDVDNIKKVLEDAKKFITFIIANTDNDDTAKKLRDSVEVIDNVINGMEAAKFMYNFVQYLTSSDPNKSFLSFFNKGTDGAQDPASNIKEQL